MTKKTKSWIEAELEDTLDEMFEEEFNAPALTEEMRKIYRDSILTCWIKRPTIVIC